MSLGTIPLELRVRPQWVTWRYEQRDDKQTKVPYRADGTGKASSTDPATWGTYDQAINAADWLDYDGIGYVFAPDDPYCGIDLDDELPEHDRQAIAAALDSYTEWSVSRTGMHVIVRATIERGRHPAGLGIFDNGRYFVMTGAHVLGTPTTIEERQTQLEQVLAHYLPAPEPERRPPQPVELDDRDLLDKAFAARNGHDFQRLYNGDTTGFASASEADLAFCCTAAFWTGRDPARIDAWLRSSGLYRDKWDRDDYRQRTIELAVNGTRDTYTPARPRPTQPTPAEPAGPDEPKPRPWQSTSWADFRDTAPPAHTWLIDGLIPAGALAFIAGPPKRGKTWVGIGTALCIALAHPFAGQTVPTARHVLYVALEGSQTGLRTRIGALTRGFGHNPDTDDLHHLHMLYRPRPFDLAELATAEWLLDETNDVDAHLIIIDVLRAAARFQENVAEDFHRIRDHLEPLLTAGRTVMLLHHFGKLTDNQKERSPGERMAGTGAMYGALDVGLLITQSDEGARKLRIDVEARDFAAPEALGIHITGTGGGKHGGFRYEDIAVLELDHTATLLIDWAGLAEQLFTDGQWRSGSTLAEELETGRATLEQHLAQDPRITRWDRDGRELGLAWNARPWGTPTMYQKACLESQTSQTSTLAELAEMAWFTPSKEGGDNQAISTLLRDEQANQADPDDQWH